MPWVLEAGPFALSTLSGRLRYALADSLTFLESVCFRWFISAEVLDNSKKSAGEHQEHNCQRHTELLSVLQGFILYV